MPVSSSPLRHLGLRAGAGARTARPANRSPAFTTRASAVIKAWFRQPKQVATVIPSSRFLTNATTALLPQMRSDARLLAVEKTVDFKPALDLIDDQRLTVEWADASELTNLLTLHDLQSPDVIVLGIPFSAIESDIAYQLRGDIQKFARPLFGDPKIELVPFNLPPLRLFTRQKAERC